MRSREWDYVIAGGGTAGSVLASRLTENSSIRVLLIEAGGEYAPELSVPLASLRRMTHYSWRYFTTQQSHSGHRRLSLPFGKVLGGSSSINAMMYCRGSAACYDRWEAYGNPSWSFKDVLPYFIRSENQERGPSERHGVGGPVDVSDPRHRAPFSEAFVEACLELGIPPVTDFNGQEDEGAGFYQVMQRRGGRVSAATVYLAAARRRANLYVETGATVHRVLIERGHATGVEFVDREGNHRTVRAGTETIICAGALNSPKLLMLSGIGPTGDLRAHGIPLVLDLPGVGANLQDHVRVPVLYESGAPSPGDMRNWPLAAVQYVFGRRGPLASNCCESGALLRSHKDAPVPDLQFVTHFQSAAYPGAVDLQYCLAITASRGRVTLRSADPHTPPAIDPNYLAEEADVRLAIRGMRLAREIANTRTLRTFPLKREIAPGSDVASDLEIERYVRASAETCYHLAGTCRMGSGRDAVVDSQLRIRGVTGLRVVDASVLPELPNGNTAAMVYMIAERAADMIQRGASLTGEEAGFYDGRVPAAPQ